jgi:AraC family transcriptional regulator
MARQSGHEAKSMSTHYLIAPVLGEVRRRRAFSGFALLETMHKPGESLPRHRHANSYLTIVVGGTYYEAFRRRGEVCRPQSVRFLPSEEQHMNSFPVSTLCLNVELFPDFPVRPVERIEPCGGGEIKNTVARTIGQQLYREFAYEDSLTEFAALTAIVDLLSLADIQPRSDRCPAPWLLRVRDYVEEHCSGALWLGELAAIAGRHPVHLSSEFRRHFGKTISQFARERRILRATSLQVSAKSGANLTHRLSNLSRKRYRAREVAAPDTITAGPLAGIQFETCCVER